MEKGQIGNGTIARQILDMCFEMTKAEHHVQAYCMASLSNPLKGLTEPFLQYLALFLIWKFKMIVVLNISLHF
jgi:hypothetical protein